MPDQLQHMFERAVKSKSKLRLALFGPSGSGKTYTSLRLAAGIGGSVALIDTERRSASKYADRFEFDVLDLDERDINTYVGAIAAAAGGGYNVLIIDSMTHAWQELLAEVEKIARAKYSGNTWSAWSEGTPMQRKLVDALLDYPGHIIATMRTKTEWLTQKDDRGKMRPVRVGLAPQQGKGIEYEFDLLMELTADHMCTVIKDRSGQYQDVIIEMPGEELGQELAEWLDQGEAPKPRKKKAPAPAEKKAAGKKKATGNKKEPSVVSARTSVFQHATVDFGMSEKEASAWLRDQEAEIGKTVGAYRTMYSLISEKITANYPPDDVILPGEPGYEESVESKQEQEATETE